ncbi:TonB-dependent receptor domain-containing protein [Stakelama saccharophila]|uniref:TonB-dependent receptor n=1 Tax=Stakelama saccharophila TaxID=3075605 RepID=A0ABZ0BBL8_9SPHN|nr:TonB-dependent receptor [Stakelama sp. W311]WNO54679.1 TonB-dependent receptor [Stakelama sp. W311]
MKTYQTFARKRLRATTALQAVALIGAGLLSGVNPALAQSTQSATDDPVEQDQEQATVAPQATQDSPEQGANEIIVTGSILRRTDTETASPVTVLSSESLEQRGINTVSDAVQRLSANGAGTIAQGWNTGSNFATGANAPSLRGLSVQSTLTVFDGLRMAPYPLADDGQRNFVDLNTIPEGIIDRIEVLRDGASSTYGADAVAGVINVITKKQIQGVHLDASGGISQRGDGGEYRISGEAGYGDLDEQGFNVYVAGEYQKTQALYARDRGYPFNTDDLSRICNDAGACMPNYVTNGIGADGTFNGLGSTVVPVFRRYNGSGISVTDPLGETTTLAPGEAALSPYELIGNCGPLTSVTLNGDQQSSTSPFTGNAEDGYEFSGANYSGPVYGADQCQTDYRNKYSQLLPEQERLGFAGRVTANLDDRTQVYASANYYQVRTQTQLSPMAFASQTTPPGAVAYNPVFLPAYVCEGGAFTDRDNPVDNGCTAENGRLNPNNPYAADGDLARLIGRYDRPRSIYSKSRALRGALGVDGSFGDDWNYSVKAVASNTQLTIEQGNYLIPGRLQDVIADGSYNFIDQSQNSEEVRDYIAPLNRTRSESNLWQVDATLSKSLFELPGGPLQAAVGVSYRHESIDNPSANPANESSPYDRYYGVNSVGAEGSRNVRSAYFEINAPVIDSLEINGSGRFDSYSSGQENFSPKIGAKFQPIPELAIRGTFSKGFRIPSFNEAYGLPTTGYVTRQVDCEQFVEFCAAHSPTGDAADANQYATGNYSIGLTSTGNPELDPEKSTSWTAGAVFSPKPNLSFTVDYWHIKIKGLIGGVDYSDIPDLYYANNGNVDVEGITVRPGLEDPQFPNALPLIGFIEYSYQNADSQIASGVDLGMNASIDLGPNIQLISNATASYLEKLEKVFDDGTVQSYAGTLSPCNITSCSGSPRWRANWQNTLQTEHFSLSATVYYTDGYDLASIDYGGVKGDCEASIGGSVVTYSDGTPVKCEVGAQWNVDMSGSIKVNDRFSLYMDVLNVFDIDPVFDPSGGYSINQYNPAWAGPNIMGRFFRVGARVNF